MNNWKLRHSFTGNATSDVQTVNGHLADPAYHLTTNVLPYSQDFTQWANVLGATLTANAATAPDGTTTATSWDSPTSTFRILRTVPQTLSASTNYVFSFYAKNIDATDAAYRIYNTTTATDVVAGTSYISEINTSDWTRIEVQFTTGATPTDEYSCYVGSVDFSGEILFWGAQLEEGDTATSYVPTNGEPVTLPDTFNVTVVPDGKEYAAPLFIPRTNLVPYSENLENIDWFKTRCTMDDNDTTGPEGVLNGSKMTSTDPAESYIQDVITTTQTKVAWSFWAKKGDLDYVHGLLWDNSASGCRQWFNVSTGEVGGSTSFGSGYSVDSASIKDYGNGWYRCVMIVNCSVGDQGCRVNISDGNTSTTSATNSYGYFYGLQLEDASVATEYIPTNGSAVTRDWSAFGRVQNQLPGISNGTHTHTGAASGSGIAATTITGSGSGATFAYEFDTLGVLTTLTADGAGSGYKVGDKLSIDTTEGHTIEFRLVEGSNAATVSVSMGAAKPNKPIPFPVSKMRVEGLTDRTVLFMDERSRYVFPKPTPYLLDTYEGAAAAYSLRRLRSAYTGPAVRVRRASNNDELDIYFNRDGSLDTATLEAFCAGTDGFVKVWFDQGQGGNDATQTSTASQPKIVSSGSVVTENGLPTVQFSDSRFEVGSTDLYGQTDFDAYIAYATSDNSYILFGDSYGSGYFSYVINSSEPSTSLQIGYNETSLYVNGAEIPIDGSTERVDLYNACVLGTMTLEVHQGHTTSSWGDFKINAYGGRQLTGNVSEIILYNSDQSANRTGIESNINAHYGIYP